MRLTHVRLLVHAFGTSIRFWRDAPGLAVTFGDEAGPLAEAAE